MGACDVKYGVVDTCCSCTYYIVVGGTIVALDVVTLIPHAVESDLVDSHTHPLHNARGYTYDLRCG